MASLDDTLRRRLLAGAVTLGSAAAVTAGLGLGARTVLSRQAAVARKLIGKPLGEQAPGGDRTYKKRFGNPLELVVLGDSIAAGLGAERPQDTLGGRLAKGLAKRTERAVRLTTVAVVGSESSALPAQLEALDARMTGRNRRRTPDAAVIVVGGNDVTHRVPVAESVRHLTATVAALRERGAVVVVGTCPDLGALKPVPQPLRSLGSRASRQLAQAQATGATAAGAHAVSLAHVVGPFFITNPDEMFSLDRFHPSALGYRRTAKALLPSVLTALGLDDRVPFGHHAPASSGGEGDQPPDEQAGEQADEQADDDTGYAAERPPDRGPEPPTA